MHQYVEKKQSPFTNITTSLVNTNTGIYQNTYILEQKEDIEQLIERSLSLTVDGQYKKAKVSASISSSLNSVMKFSSEKFYAVYSITRKLADVRISSATLNSQALGILDSSLSAQAKKQQWFNWYGNSAINEATAGASAFVIFDFKKRESLKKSIEELKASVNASLNSTNINGSVKANASNLVNDFKQFSEVEVNVSAISTISTMNMISNANISELQTGKNNVIEWTRQFEQLSVDINNSVPLFYSIGAYTNNNRQNPSAQNLNFTTGWNITNPNYTRDGFEVYAVHPNKQFTLIGQYGPNVNSANINLSNVNFNKMWIFDGFSILAIPYKRVETYENGQTVYKKLYGSPGVTDFVEPYEIPIEYQVRHVNDSGFQSIASNDGITGKGSDNRISQLRVAIPESARSFIQNITNRTISVKYETRHRSDGWSSGIDWSLSGNHKNGGNRIHEMKVWLVGAPSGYSVKYEGYLAYDKVWKSAVSYGSVVPSLGTTRNGLYVPHITSVKMKIIR